MSRYSEMTDHDLAAAHWRHRHAKAMFIKGRAIVLADIEQDKIQLIEAEADRRGLVLCVRTPA